MSRDQSPGPILIRRATAGDLTTIKSLYGQLAPEVTNVEEDFPTLLADPNSVCLVVEEKGRPIGMAFCYVRTSLSSGKKMVIDEIVIDRDRRGRGYGRAVIEHCIKLAQERGVENVELACALSNPALYRFYEKLGFEHRMRLYGLFLGEDTPARGLQSNVGQYSNEAETSPTR